MTRENENSFRLSVFIYAWPRAVCRLSGLAREVFLQRLPIILLPSSRQVLCLAIREAGVIEEELSLRTLFLELELRDRIGAGIPAHHAPGLHDTLVRNELDISPHNMPSETRKSASRFRADRRRSHSPHWAELRHVGELLGVGKGLVDALSARLENDFLMDGFGRMRNLVICGGCGGPRTSGGSDSSFGETQSR